MAKMPLFDWERGDFMLDSRGKVAVAHTDDDPGSVIEQIVIKASQTPRGVFLIYASENADADHKYGSDVEDVLAADLEPETRRAELEDAVRESLIYDPRITDVTDISVTENGTDGAEITCTVDSIYGATVEVVT